LGYSPADLSLLEAEAQAVIEAALQFAEASPIPSPQDAYADLMV
jgi:TPP-dependent pyruvate/acetoin dehydrogenase alpha subunit